MPLEPPFYVVSDTHFFHDNIVKYCSRDLQIQMIAGKPIDHNEYMIQRWNQVVGQDDKVLHLGDVFLKNDSTDIRFRHSVLPRLNGEKYLILGNHDRKAKYYEGMGFKVMQPFTTWINGKRVSFAHYPQDLKDVRDNEIRVHGHIHNNGYPIGDDWTLGSAPTRKNQINVSVEAIEYTPVAITELIK